MRYVSDRIISFSLSVGGKDKRICFTACMGSGSMYVATSEAEIKALESSPMYGKVYRRAIGQDIVPKAKPVRTKPKAKDVEGISSWQEAVEYLATHCGSDVESLTTPDEILAEAAKKGIRFTNLNRTEPCSK